MHAVALLDALQAKLRAAIFSEADLGAQMATGLRPALGIDFVAGPADMGKSKIGGRPHLPKRGFLGLGGPKASRWPTAGDWQDAVVAGLKKQGLDKEEMAEAIEALGIQMSFVGRGDPLAFIAQINFAECKPYDFAGVLPDRGILYLFSTDESTAMSSGSLAVVRHYDGPQDALVSAEFPAKLASRGRFAERVMKFGPAFLLAEDDDSEKLRFDSDDEDQFEAIARSLGGKTAARMLGLPYFFDSDSAELFDAETDVLLLALAGEHIWQEGETSSVYGEGTFFVTAAKDALARRKLDDANVVFEGGT